MSCPDGAETPTMPDTRDKHFMNLLGVPCPLNWARARARLEDMGSGEILEILVDDPNAEHDIPQAAESCGHAVVETRRGTGGLTIVIER